MKDISSAMPTESVPVQPTPIRVSPTPEKDDASTEEIVLSAPCWASPQPREAKKEKEATKEIADKGTTCPSAPVWASPKLTETAREKKPTTKDVVDNGTPVPAWASPKLKKTEPNRDLGKKSTPAMSLPVWGSPSLKKTKKVKKPSKETLEENSPVWALATGKRDSTTLPEWASETLKQMIMK
jgi:hypothetical protein